MTAAADDPVRKRHAAVERLALAARTRDRAADDLAAAGTIDERNSCRADLRTAAVMLHAAVVDAHRAGVPTACIATAAGTTARAVAVLLRRGQATAGHRQVGGLPTAQRTQALDDLAVAVREHGTAHPSTHRSIVEAHAYGVSPIALGRVAGITPERITGIVLAAPTVDREVVVIDDDVDPAAEIARATLATEVRLRGSARSVRDVFPAGSDERRLALRLLRIADRKVVDAVRAALAAGVRPVEVASTVGVTIQRISHIARSGPAE